MKRKYLIIATIALAMLILASSVPAIVSSLPEAQSQSLAKPNQNTVMSEYQPTCPEESYNKITELHEKGLSEEGIAEELAFPLDIVNRYLEGNYTPPPCPESKQSMPLSECPTYSKIKDLYGEGWSEEVIAETLELPLDVVRGFISGDYTIISACPEPYQKSEKNASSSNLLGKHEVTDEQSENSSRFVVVGETSKGIYGDTVTTVTPSEDELLEKYEKSNKQFKKGGIGDKIVYWHQRKIDNATVAGDYIVYIFDKDAKELLEKRIHWQSDLPEHVTTKITKEQAESMVRGEVQFTTLYFKLPNSPVYPIKPTPKNPCWVVRSIDENDNMIVTIVDSVDGEILGYGVPPPYGAFSLSGPQEFFPCSGAWTDFYQNASSWFNTMGYPTEEVEWPSWEKIRSHIQSYETVMFYEIAHSKDSQCFKSGCQFGQLPWLTCWGDIQTAMYDYPKMPFTFIGSCCGHCDAGDNTLSYAFRKGSTEDTVTVGYCHMNSDDCSDCWNNSLAWQDALFNYMNQGWTVKDAFDQACLVYPECGVPNCVRFAGDTNFKVVPVVQKMAIGEAVDNTDLSWTAGGDAGWFGQPNTYYYGGDAAQSGTISHNQDSWVQTTVTGPGTLKFYWKVSSEANFDFLRFYIDGVEQERISGTVDWQQKTYGISSGSHTLKWTYTKDGATAGGWTK
jgi:hypothetical protein